MVRAAVVVDFGTAVTFDVLSPDRKYIGGVIAPGLNAMTEYLHRKTRGCFPRSSSRSRFAPSGKTTTEAHALRRGCTAIAAWCAKSLDQIRREQFPRHKMRVVATGGDAELIGGGLKIFDAIDAHLTLEGLRLIAPAESLEWLRFAFPQLDAEALREERRKVPVKKVPLRLHR